MFTQGDIKISLDTKAKLLRVYANQMPIANFKPLWQEVASYANPADWEASPYASKVTSEEVQDAIAWFWIDITEGVV